MGIWNDQTLQIRTWVSALLLQQPVKRLFKFKFEDCYRRYCMRRYYGRLIYFSLIKICVPIWRVALPSICGTSEFELWDAVVKDSWSPLGVAIEVHSFRGQDVSPSNNGSRSFAFAASFGDPGFETLLDCSNSRYPTYQNTQEKDLWTRVGADGCLTLATVLYRHSLDYGPTLGFIPWNYELILDYSSLHPSSLSHAGVLATIKKICPQGFLFLQKLLFGSRFLIILQTAKPDQSLTVNAQESFHYPS